MALLPILFLLRLLLPMPQFQAQVLDTSVSIGYGLATGDVDGDRKPDILLADQKQIVWYRNGDWKRFVMAENLTQRDNVCIAARDIDGDGRVEVAVGAQWNPGETGDAAQSGSVHYLIRPEDPAQMWEPVKLHHEPTVHRMKWVQTGRRQFQLLVVPLHGRGNQNGKGAGVNILAYSVPKSPRSPWSYQIVDSTLHMTHNFDVLEDKEGTQLWVGSLEGIKRIVYRDGKWTVPEVQPWVEWGFGAGEVRRGFLPGKKPFVVAVEPMHGNLLVVYKPGDTNSRQLLKENMNQGHALACADLLGLGYSQIVVGWRNPDNDGKVGIRLFVPADGAGTGWQEYLIDDNKMACEDLLVTDLNGDGRPDIIAAGRDTHNLIIYWNKTERVK
jgi:hypothetical protein